MYSRVLEPTFKDYRLRNLQARIAAHLIEYLMFSKEPGSDAFKEAIKEIIEPVTEILSAGDYESADLGLRIFRFFITNIDEKETSMQQQAKLKLLKNYFYVPREVAMRCLYPILPILLPCLLETFTNEEIQIQGRVMILHLFYQLIRLVAWADGIDNELVAESLGETFQSWMALFLQIIQSNPRQNFNLKRNALKCLVVIFRDMINYSKESINLILKPAWKLLNSHLPIFTEVVAYNQPVRAEDDDEDEEHQEERDPLNESFDTAEIYGVEGMTYHLIELLGSLV